MVVVGLNGSKMTDYHCEQVDAGACYPAARD